MKRSEVDQIAQAPLKVTFGKDEYHIPLLKIGASRIWREKLSSELKELFAPMAAQGLDGLGSALTAQFVKYPDKILELLKSYCPGLPWEKISDEATEEQVLVAYSRVVEVAFPYLAHLIASRQALAK